MKLQNKVVLITGANGGLGTSVTNAFLEAEARVVGVSKSIRASEFPNPAFTAMPAEITSRESAQTIAESVIAKFGRIDALVHLVGAFAGGKPVHETDGATFDQMFDVNFRSAVNMIAAVLPAMRKQGSGRILAIGSRVALDPQPTASAYGASKAALVSLIRTIALENKSVGITANVVLPSTMDTPINRKVMPDADFSKWVQPIQVADVLVHLTSDQASQINGAVIPIYGGEL
jgi:NAD(P)-dependent dehydrogenase (short-subunit alcohol dehydrogenase family)